jgi:hypothetical protein
VAVATDGYEVEVAGVLVSDEALWYSASLEESGRASLDNPPFAVRLQRMGHPCLRISTHVSGSPPMCRISTHVPDFHPCLRISGLFLYRSIVRVQCGIDAAVLESIA